MPKNHQNGQGQTLKVSIDDPMNCLNRELSMLKLRRRVLFEAMNPANPDLGRLPSLEVVDLIFDAFFCAHHRCDER
jgi:polyphosphate kinase